MKNTLFWGKLFLEGFNIKRSELVVDVFLDEVLEFWGEGHRHVAVIAGILRLIDVFLSFWAHGLFLNLGLNDLAVSHQSDLSQWEAEERVAVSLGFIVRKFVACIDERSDFGTHLAQKSVELILKWEDMSICDFRLIQNQSLLSNVLEPVVFRIDNEYSIMESVFLLVELFGKLKNE